MSTPSHTPFSSPSVAAGRRLAIRQADADLDLHFEPYRRIINDSYEEGMIVTWSDGDLQYDIWAWPLDDDGNCITPEQISAAFEKYDIPYPTCPCISLKSGSEDSDPKSYARIWVVQNTQSAFHGEIAISCARRVCKYWKSLSELINHPNLVTHQYPKRTSPGMGIPSFDPYNILKGKHSNPINPPSPLVQTPPRRSGLSGVNKSKKKSAVTEQAKMALQDELGLLPSSSSPIQANTVRDLGPPSNQLAFQSAQGLKHLFSGPNVFMASAPSPSPSPKMISLEAYLALETECKQMKAARAFFELQCEVSKRTIEVIKANAAIDADNANIESYKVPGDCCWGETACLFFFPEISELTKLNRQVPGLESEELTNVFTALSSPKGITPQMLWRAIDYCNCGHVFTKTYLHSTHGPTCASYTYEGIHSPLSALNGSFPLPSKENGMAPPRGFLDMTAPNGAGNAGVGEAMGN